jgi:phenylpropionate dioxygenase-like ring-hydroxylating dioxygenase large terminal subunit
MTLELHVDGPLRGDLVETIPSSWYTDPELLAHETDTIFKATWQYVGTNNGLARVGDYFTTTLAGVPLIISRSAEGVRALVNSCRHRFTPVAYGAGNTRRFSCPYHAWTYDLNGTLCAAPRSDQVEHFDVADYPLKRLPVATWGPMVFASLNPDVTSFEEWIEPLAKHLERAGCDVESLTPRKRTTYSLKANWKIVAENYLECYHCKVAHPAYARTFDVNRSEGYPFAVSGDAFVSETTLQDATGRRSVAAPYQCAGPITVNQNGMLFPNVAPTIWPGQNNLMLYTWSPVSVDETVGHFDYFLSDDWTDEAAEGLFDFLDRVGTEDQELVESVQRGLTGNQIETGRLVPDEGQILHFHDLIRKFMDSREFGS